MLTLQISDAFDQECPSDQDCQWKLYSFQRRHTHFRQPHELVHFAKDGSLVGNDAALRYKFKVGLAFMLDYFEHGDCRWSITGMGPQCQWDNSPYCGILIWEHKPSEIGAKTYADRAKDAADFLEYYTAWCNGHLYEFNINEDGEDEGWSGPYHDTAVMFQDIRDGLAGRTVDEVEGGAKWLCDHHSYLPKPVPSGV